MISLLAVIRSASPTPATASAPAIPGATPAAADATAAATPAPDLIRDIAPPIDYFPYPPWVIVTLAVGLALLAGLAAWALWRWWKQRPGPTPPSPRSVALAQLRRLTVQVETLDAYPFSIEVSHVLREFVESEYRIPALEQTSPEFLASIADRPTVSDEHRKLLADFLERCDAIKFGRVGGDVEVNRALLESATSFVQGGTL